MITRYFKVMISLILAAGLLACGKSGASSEGVVSSGETSYLNESSSDQETSSSEETEEPGNAVSSVNADLSELEGVYEGSYTRTSYLGSEPSTAVDDSPYVVFLVNGIPMIMNDNKKGSVRQMIAEDREKAAAQITEQTTMIAFDPETLTGSWNYLGGGGSPNTVSYTFSKEADGTITLDFFHTIYDDDEPDKKEFERMGSYEKVSGSFD